MIGQTINNYLLERKLGEGGMSEVFLARHNRIDRVVAIKVLHKNLFTNELVRNRFKNEANALIKLEHPNIVKIYDYIEQKDFACLIVEFIDGISLDEYINKFSGPLPDSKASVIICAVLDAVQYAHNNNILHRDIKPGNIMVSRDGKSPKVMDFGIAKFTDIATPNVTHINTQLGTPFYMSPEQVKGLPNSPSSDIYSIGVTLFEMVTGKCPYIGITTLFELQTKIVNEPLPPTSLFYPDVSPEFQEAIKIATNKLPGERFKSCSDFKDFLQKTKKNKSVIIPSIQEKPKLETKNKSHNKKSRQVYWFGLLLILTFGVFLFIMKNSSNSTIRQKKDTDSANIENNKIAKIYSSQADSIITKREKSFNVRLNDSVKRNELVEKLISLLRSNFKQDKIDSLLNKYQQFFILQPTPVFNNPSPPNQSMVRRDLLNKKLSNGLIFTEATVITNFYPGLASEKFYATLVIKISNNDTIYKFNVTYKKVGNSYKYISNNYLEKSVPPVVPIPVVITPTDPKPHNPTPEKKQVIDDLKERYLKCIKVICNTKFNDLDDITGYNVGDPDKNPRVLTITFQVDFFIKKTSYKCKVFYKKNSDTGIFDYDKTKPICD